MLYQPGKQSRMRILQVLDKFLAYGQRECDIIARDVMRMNWRRQKTSWGHENNSFCNQIREFRTKVEYVPLAQSLCIIAVNLGVDILYLSYRTHNSHKLQAACNTCVYAAPSCLERWKTGDFQTFCFTDGHKANETPVPGLGATSQYSPLPPLGLLQKLFSLVYSLQGGFIFLVICLAHCGLHNTNLNSRV